MNAAGNLRRHFDSSGNLRRHFDSSGRDSLSEVILETLTSILQTYQADQLNRDIGLDVNLIDIIVDYAYPDAQPFRLIEYDMNAETLDQSSLTRTFLTSSDLIDHLHLARQHLIDELCELQAQDVPVIDARVNSQFRPAQVAYGYDHRSLIASQYPDWAGFEIESEIWRRWQAVDDSVRALYYAGARRERVTYEIQVEVTAAAKGGESHRNQWLNQLIASLQPNQSSGSHETALTSLLTQTSRAQLTLFHAFIPIDHPFPVVIACIEGADYTPWSPRSSSPGLDNRITSGSMLSEWRAADSSEVLLLLTTRTGGYDLLSFQSERSANQWLKLHNAEIARADVLQVAAHDDKVVTSVPNMNAYQTISDALPYTLHTTWTRAQRHL